MITISLPFAEGMVAVIGLTPEELRQMANGVAVIEPVDFRSHFKEGLPLPVIVQLVMVEKNSDLEERIEKMFPGSSERTVTVKKPKE